MVISILYGAHKIDTHGTAPEMDTITEWNKNETIRGILHWKDPGSQRTP
jgi:hypothetical protein